MANTGVPIFASDRAPRRKFTYELTGAQVVSGGHTLRPVRFPVLGAQLFL
jgi:hypothetical protein